MNPPYSVKNWNQEGLKVTDRFEIAGVLPPDSKGDYAFLLHGLFHLGQEEQWRLYFHMGCYSAARRQNS